MDRKSLIVIQNCVRNAKNTIEHLACDNYPYTEFYDSELREMFYSLNDFCIKLSNKIDELEGK